MGAFVIHSSQIDGDEVVFSPSDAYHMAKVLRKNPGDVVRCRDEGGRVYACTLTAVSAERASGQVFMAERPREEFPQTVPVSLVFPLLKNKRTDWLVQKCTELGTDEFIPYLWRRTVVRPGDDARVGRFEKIALESCKQCERGDVPTVRPICRGEGDLAALLAPRAGEEALRVLFWEGEKRVFVKELLQGEVSAPQRVYLAVGPEGGIEEAEVEALRGLGFLTAGMGRTVLRAETACVAGVALAAYEFYQPSP